MYAIAETGGFTRRVYNPPASGRAAVQRALLVAYARLLVLLYAAPEPPARSIELFARDAVVSAAHLAAAARS